jgi:hypothetical protein
MESEHDQLKRYIQLQAEDLKWVAGILEDSPDMPKELLIADYKARAASLTRIANAPPLTPRPASPKIPKKSPFAVPQSGSTADGGHPSPKTRTETEHS